MSVFRFSRFLFAGVFALLFVLSATASTTPDAESQRLLAWLDQVFEQELEHHPETKTRLGMIDDLEAYGRWNDYSDAAAIAENVREQEYLATLRHSFDFEALSDAARLSYQFAEHQYEMSDRLHDVRESRYVFSPMNDVVSDLTTFLINSHRIENADHARAYLRRLQSIDEVSQA